MIREKDKDKSDTPAAATNTAANTRANARKTNSNVSVPEEMQDIKDCRDGRKFLEKHSLYCPPGEPASNSTLAYCLHQISAMPNVPKQTVNAIRATAFMLEEIEEMAINETIRIAFDSQITEFTSDMKILAEDVNAKIDGHLKTALAQIEKAAAAAETHPQEPTAARNGAGPVAPSTTSYSSALINPPPNVNPKLAAREGIRARQVLLTGIKESAFGQYDSQKLKAELNKALKNLGFKNGKIRSVVQQKDGNTLIEVDSDDAAKWFANGVNTAEFCSFIGDCVGCKARTFNVLAFNSPLNIDIRDDKHRVEIIEANGLEENTILALRWAKPPTRRSPQQRSAHLVLSFANADSANRAITNGLIICNKKCHVERIKKEPIRCLRCQGWNHIANECSVMLSKCGNCAENHNTADCRHPKKTRCVTCNTEDHASWSRACPTFLRKVDDYNERNPENLLPYYPTSDPWTWSSGETNATQTQLKLNTAKKATTLGKQRNITPREPIGTNASPVTGTNTRPTPFNRMIDIPGWNIGLDNPVNNGWWDNELNDIDEAGPSSSATRPTNNFNTNAPQNLTQASNSNA